VRHNVINAISAVSNSHPENTPAYVEKLLKKRDSYFSQIAIAIHTVHQAQPAVLKKVAELVKKYKTLFTTHVAETQASVARNLEVHGDLTIPTLKRYGLANSRTIMSHCVHLTESEIAMVAKHHMGVVHLPTSNKLHKSGEFPYPTFVKYDAINQIALGTDSVISKNSLDILSEALQARIMHQERFVVYYEELFKMMTSNAADMLHMKDRGRILPGYRADIAFWKVRDRGFVPYDESNPASIIGNMITHGGRNVRDLMINGEFVISNRRHNLVNETRVLDELQSHHQQLRKRVPKK
jgi:5-methylthioadenosine/S-adenosylhomocysteine deaminase